MKIKSKMFVPLVEFLMNCFNLVCLMIISERTPLLAGFKSPGIKKIMYLDFWRLIYQNIGKNTHKTAGVDRGRYTTATATREMHLGSHFGQQTTHRHPKFVRVRSFLCLKKIALDMYDITPPAPLPLVLSVFIEVISGR